MAILETISGVPDAARGLVYWLVLFNSLSICFIFHRTEARAILGIWLAVMALTIALAGLEVPSGLIAAGAAAFWTPLLFWLVRRNPVDGIREPWGLYLVILFASNLVFSVLALANLWFRAIP
ncbi:MAG: hypothetical protein CMI62_04445 [Parvibaculum sp.]|jgi:hypothetical protein|uniref:hypothetical protein n=1 Tax=Parvibaculum sp. TaxID=2024848 RepID=UPI000C36F0B5|nr:hypothetical protein [Parvibaculum sp.]MAU59964.1 hypothetical protein [Parvibaculum sp.]HAC59146.1 hypothetical protein [Rhodobiaceae bacterium]|tara:strand:- start:2536 stop:2901 length:366 start_codon:yes stop_codon:yes gene_type:complete